MATLYSAHTIKNTLNLLSGYRDSITDKTDMKKAKNRFNTDLNLILTMIDELTLTLRSNVNQPVSTAELRQLENSLKNMLHQIKNIENEDTLAIKRITSALEVYKNWDFHKIGIYEAERWIDYLIDDIYDEDREELSIQDVNTIMSSINTNRPYNIFSPRCNKGTTLKEISNHGDCTTYGLEARHTLHAHAKEKLNRVIKGEMTGSKISNDTFDIMHIAPPVSWEASFGATGNLIEKKEKAMLRNTIKYLRKDGILIYTLPVTRLTKDMAFIFSKLLDDVQILKASNNVMNMSLPYIHVIGRKSLTKEAKQEIYLYLTEVPKMYVLPEELDIEYNLPQGGIIAPELFRGSILDESELEEIVQHSGLLQSFFKQHEIEERDDSMRPLLPFNMGQIGLVLTSGCLDGVVEEYEGQYHAIKGMVTKVRDVNNNVEDNDETSIETISNKVQINLLTPDGKFIELA